MELKFKSISGICIATTLCLGSLFTVNAYAQSAPGAEARCERDCNGPDAGSVQRCHVAVTRCKERADRQGSEYRKCRSSGKSVADCRENY